MNDAFDTTRRELVRANHASHSQLPERYLCPVCQTEVVYAAGDCMVPHFRHRRGGDHDECERYCSGFSISVPLAAHAREHLDAVLVAQVDQRQSPERVLMAVRFRPSYRAARVEFVQGHVTTPYVVHAGVRQQYFRIEHVDVNYVVQALTVDGQRVTHLIDGFGETPAVFRVTVEKESVSLPKHRVLRPGRYLVLSKVELDGRLTKEVGAVPVVTAKGLHGITLTIPDNPSRWVQDNVLAVLGFRTERKIAEYSIREPWIVTELATDCWEIDRDEDLVVVMRAPQERDQRPPRVLVQERQQGQITTSYPAVPQGSGDFMLCFKGGKMAAEVVRIGLTDPARFVLEIRRTRDAGGTECARLLFELRGKHGRRCRVGWAAHELTEALKCGGKSIWEISGVDCPRGVELTLSDAGGRKQVLETSTISRQLRDFLRGAHYPCRLHATGIGSRLGYPDVVIPRLRIGKAAYLKEPCRTQAMARTRLEVRMQSAFARGLISIYARGAVRHDRTT
jgi:hypothetical protein